MRVDQIKSDVGLWKIRRKPIKENSYVIGVDTASGKNNSNDTVATVINMNDGQQDALLSGQIDPERAGPEVESAGYFYNTSILAIENEKHGVVIINYLRQKEYPAIYFHPQNPLKVSTNPIEFGWSARKNRPLAIDWLQTDLGMSISTKADERKRAIYVFFPETITQLGYFVRNPKTGKMEAMSGRKDDHVSALYIANFVRREKLPEIFAVKPEKPRPMTYAEMVVQQRDNDGEEERELGGRNDEF